MVKIAKKNISTIIQANNNDSLSNIINQSWSKISAFWPLKNFIAANPLAGFEHLKFKSALEQVNAYFQRKNLPQEMQKINLESIKWLQIFFDENQSTIQMPHRHMGFLKSMLSLVRFDQKLHLNEVRKKLWLENLYISFNKTDNLITEILEFLDIPVQNIERFLTLMLTTLPGWAAHIQYHIKLSTINNTDHVNEIMKDEYLVFRLILTYLIWPEAKSLLLWNEQNIRNVDISRTYDNIKIHEKTYQTRLIQKFYNRKQPREKLNAKAQFIFCIDIRSEPFRRALEQQGNYETFGFAGSFGIPVYIKNIVTGNIHSSCPVLLKPNYFVTESPCNSIQYHKKHYQKIQLFKKIYQSLKYTFTTPFCMVEIIGPINGIWMGLKNFFPSIATHIKKFFKKSKFELEIEITTNIQDLPFEKQLDWALNALQLIGLTNHFSPLVILCGHGSTTENNAHATALNCSACGGHHGAPNARILAKILNSNCIRQNLKEQNINIPENTVFLAAQHNTTTDEVIIYHTNKNYYVKEIADLTQALKRARDINSLWRSQKMGIRTNIKQASKITALLAQDWSQVRPEWGLAGNAAFIIGPRWLTQDIDLEGRSFLHSYNWEKDNNFASLKVILTTTMLVAQWINTQYLFSTLDNVAFGGGSKITKNISGKIGIMQGNASDLMHGLPLQSVFKSDYTPYHTPMRLTVIIYAPKSHIISIIENQIILQNLFSNGWVHFFCLDPNSKQIYKLKQDLAWNNMTK